MPPLPGRIVDALLNTLSYVSKISFRVDSCSFFESMNELYIELKLSFTACISLVQEPNKYHIGETIAVVYEHTKRTQEMVFIDWAQ